MKNMEQQRAQGRSQDRNCYDINASMSPDKDGRTYTYGKEPDVARENDVKTDVYFAPR